MNSVPGGLTVDIGDRECTIAMAGGGEWTIPVGAITLVDGELEGADRLAPEQLTNALGSVHDHFDDIVVQAPIVMAAPSIEFTGRHARAVARVELGTTDLPVDYVLQRADADEVFRTLVVEPIPLRRENPGLDPDDAASIIGALCVILAIIRRLDHHAATVSTAPSDPPTNDAEH